MNAMELSVHFAEWLKRVIYPKAMNPATRQLIRMANTDAGHEIICGRMNEWTHHIADANGNVDVHKLKELAMAALDGDDYVLMGLVRLNRDDAADFFGSL